MNNAELVAKFWDTLYTRNWDVVAEFFGDDSEYTDMPTPAEDVARGAAQIVGRLRLGLEPLQSIGHVVRTVVADGDAVVTEHLELWEWPSGERAELPFVSMQEVRDGVIVRWWDYWDLATLMNVAPPWWVEHITAEAAKLGLG